MRPQMIMVLGILAVTTGAHAELSETEYIVACSNAFSRVLPSNWCVSRAEVTRSWWDHSDIQMAVDFRRVRNESDLPVLGPIEWFDVRVIFLNREYNPDLIKYTDPIPFPLLAVTDKHQVYLWGTPAADGWSNSVERLVAAVRTICPRARAAELSDRDLATNAEARLKSKREYLRREWHRNIHALTNAASVDDWSVREPDRKTDAPNAIPTP